MVIERLDAAKRLPENEDPRKQLAIAQARDLLVSAGVRDPGPKPEISLESEMERQTAMYLEREFHKHKKIGMSKGNFKDSIMGLVVPQPEEFRGRFNSPVVVFGQIPAEDQCRLAGIDYSLKGLNVCDWPDDPQNYQTPNFLYLTWTDEGERSMNRKVEDVRKELVSDERGGTEFDGIALYVVKPQVLEKRFLDLPGTALGPGDVPFLNLWNGRPYLVRYFVGNANPEFGSLVCGRKNRT